MNPVILLVFAGRRPNMELQLRWARRVLELHPQVSYEVWNLAFDRADGCWLQTVSGDRITVRNEFYGQKIRHGIRHAWEAYLPPAYRGTLFVKVDDDVVFLDPNRFGDLVAAAAANPDTIVSADVVNNGACDNARQSTGGPGCGPYESFKHAVCADAAHRWFFDNWRTACAAPIVLRPQPDWVSINAIALSHYMLTQTVDLFGRPAPTVIANHHAGRTTFGDEGAANMLPRAVLSGVMAAHLTFGPQQASAEMQTVWRRGYSGVLDQVLEG